MRGSGSHNGKHQTALAHYAARELPGCSPQSERKMPARTQTHRARRPRGARAPPRVVVVELGKPTGAGPRDEGHAKPV